MRSVAQGMPIITIEWLHLGELVRCLLELSLRAAQCGLYLYCCHISRHNEAVRLLAQHRLVDSVE
ncbi:hypothetical protein XM38_030350 [Halomicronema hongdechloris C2206]|uniref:Uncharacterized protein n=1 Tax=Halomicronema hongdechloris C2206 TaxID=1641165 RepID=A0A1Z3HP64_9CYAN|nr:hypothetical protein XM38_030350 [Halomicronema hongdechloris C2206]